MNDIQIFNYNDKEIRTVKKGGDLWWVLKDVCDVLELSNPTMIAGRLDEDERAKFDLGRQGETNIINESGLYNVILRSDKPEEEYYDEAEEYEIYLDAMYHKMKDEGEI